MKNKKIFFGIIAAALLLISAFYFGQNFTKQEAPNSGITGKVSGVLLPEGTYLLEPAFNGGMMPRPIADPQFVKVEANKFADVSIVYRTGPR